MERAFDTILRMDNEIKRMDDEKESLNGLFTLLSSLSFTLTLASMRAHFIRCICEPAGTDLFAVLHTYIGKHRGGHPLGDPKRTLPHIRPVEKLVTPPATLKK